MIPVDGLMLRLSYGWQPARLGFIIGRNCQAASLRAPRTSTVTVICCPIREPKTSAQTATESAGNRKGAENAS
jgi:hypothetical protein